MRLAFLTAPLLVLLLACRGPQDAGTPLVHGLRSGMGPEEVRAQLALGSDQWRLVDDALPPRGRGTAFRVQRVELRHMQHLGMDGRMVLYFFNDSLFRIRFHPADYPRFQHLLAEKEGLALSPGATVELEPATRVKALRDQEGGGYVLWEDTEILALWEAISKRR